MSHFEHGLELFERAVVGVDAGEIRDVVPVVTERRVEERQQPDAVHAEIANVGQLLLQAHEIPDAVIVTVVETADVKFVEHGVLVPEMIRHRSIPRSSRPTSSS